MKPQHIPYVRLNFFESTLPKGGKLLFRFLVGAAAAAALFFILSYMMPRLWVGDVVTISDSRAALVPLQHTEAQYREMDYLAQAYYNFTTYAATTLEPNAALVVFFILFQIIGWSALLAGSSNLQGLHTYVLYILFGAQFYLGNMAVGLFGGDPLKLVTLGIGLFFVLPAYLFKSKYLDWGLPRQFAVFVGLFVIYYGVVAAMGGMPLPHQAAVYPVYVHFIFGVLLVAMLSKDLGNALLLLANNHKIPERRRPPVLLYAVYGLFVILLGMSALEANEMLPHGSIGFKVPWLMAAFAPLTVYFAQNGFGQVRDILPSNMAYNLLILGLVVLGMGFWGYHLGQAEYSMRAHLERLATNFFFLVTLCHFIYTAINFNGLLKQKSLVYYILFQPSTFRFYPFWIFAALCVVLVEMVIHPLKAEMHLRATNRNVQADNLMLSGNFNYAATIYSDVSVNMYGDVKSSFNAAQLLLMNPDVMQSRTKQDNIIEFYRRAQARFDFPEAGMNLGIFLQLANRNGDAGMQLRESAVAFNDERLWTNLAALYNAAQQPDSVIALLKRAGEINPDNAVVHSNLAATYWGFGRADLAGPFIQSAYDLAPREPHVLENYYYFHLAHDSTQVEISSVADTSAANYAYNVNRALVALRQNDASTADALCRSLSTHQPSDALALAHLLAQMRMDSLENALSRLAWIGQNHEAIFPIANHNVGIYFAEHNVPEMAMGYFTTASQMGSVPDSALAAGMQADMGYLSWAFETFHALQQNHPNYNAIQELTRREKAMLDYAAGTESIYISWNFQDIKPDEALRLARYCGFSHNLERATKALEMCVALDSSDIRPYLELARIELGRGDSADVGFALAQVEAGLQNTDAQHIAARLMKARLLIRQGKAPEAALLFASITPTPADSVEWTLTNALLLEAQNQPEKAIAMLQAAHTRNPLNPEIIHSAVRMFRKRNQAYEAYLFLSKAIEFNKRNLQYWLTLAELQTELGRHQEAVETYQMAIGLTVHPQDEARIKALKTEAERRAFAAEVEVYGGALPPATN